MTVHRAPVDAAPYDEFGLLHKNAEELGLAGPLPAGRRVEAEVAGGEHVRQALQWGDAEPEFVFLHGGGQNPTPGTASCWRWAACDGVRPTGPRLVGSPRRTATTVRGADALAVAEAMERSAPTAAATIGMSLGGATNIRLAAGPRPTWCVAR